MLECRICGCKFDEQKVDRTQCNCGSDCRGVNVPCPQCGFDVLVPRHLRPKNENSLLSKIKNSFK